MTLRSIILILLLLTSCGAGPGVEKAGGGEMAQGAEKGGRSMIDCTMRTSNPIWRPGEEATISVEIRFPGGGEFTVLSSVNLVAVPKTAGLLQEEYWAPFDIATGSSTKEWQKLQPTDETHARSVRMVPSRLLWAATKSSVWPSQPLERAVPRGKYLLRVEFALEPGKTASSNEVEVTIAE
jgi:hypothetical protein